MPWAWLLPISVLRLHVGDLHDVGLGEGPRVLVTPVKAIRVVIGVYVKSIYWCSSYVTTAFEECYNYAFSVIKPFPISHLCQTLFPEIFVLSRLQTQRKCQSKLYREKCFQKIRSFRNTPKMTFSLATIIAA